MTKAEMSAEIGAGLPIGPAVEAVAALRPAPTTLRGRLVTVMPLDPVAHAKALFRGTHGAHRERLWLYLGEGPFANESTFQAWLEKRAASDDPLSFAIVDNATGEAAGHASWLRITPEHQVIEVGYIFYTSPLVRSAGGTEATYLMARHVFEHLGYRRYEWKCNALNAPSRRAALRLGFAFEGVFRQHMIVKGRNRDTAWYAMLDGEWPMRRAAFERWLAPENFDASGRQKVALSALNGLTP
jgi:RimJ/RimL family protein N-acetyltransferase